jgi:glucuronoarabinoxylan endo-1,4-beta-xylanase
LNTPDCLTKFFTMIKNTLRLALSLVLFVSTFSINANNPTPSVIMTDAPSEIKVMAVNKTLFVKVAIPQIEDVTISIETAEGAIIYNETVNVVDAFTKRYNLRELAIGNYKLVIKRKRSKTVQPLTIGVNSISVEEAKREVLPLPTVVQVGSFVNVNIPTKLANDVTVRIYDNLGVTLMEKTYSKVGLRRYDLSKLPSGVYFVEVDGEPHTINVK